MGLVDRFIRLVGTERNYLDLLTGETISRRQRDKREASIPVIGRDEYLQTVAGTRLGSIARDLSSASNDRPVQGALRDTFLGVLDDLKDTDRSATGKKATALVKIGRRMAGSTADVGDS